MRLFMKKSVFLLGCGLLLSLPSSAQKPPSPKAHPHQPSMGTQAPPMSSAQKPAAPAVQNQHRVVVVEPVRVFDPYFEYPYAYTYSPDYMSENFGYIKLKTDRKDDAVYVDGGFVD